MPIPAFDGHGICGQYAGFIWRQSFDPQTGTETAMRKQRGAGYMKKTTAFLILAIMLAACNPNMPLVTPTQAESDLEIAILTEVLQVFHECYSPKGVEVTDNLYSFSCSHSADSGYSVSMTRFDSEATARAQFEASRGDNSVSCFHGYDFYAVSSENLNNRSIASNSLFWQTGRWVISVHSSFDYAFFHYNSEDFSEAVYTSGVKHGLFSPSTCPATDAFTPALTQALISA